MIKYAERMQEIPFSTIRSLFERASQLEIAGQPIVHLDIGRPDFDTPQHIKQASVKALNEGHVHYTSNYGLLPLRQSIAKKLKNDNALSINPDNEVIVTAGVSEAIVISMIALLNPGDEVLIPGPLFPAYAMAARMAGAIPITVATHPENNYQPTQHDLQAVLSNRTKMLIVITPGNPTGVVFDIETLKMLADFSTSHNLFVLSDEIYEKLIYDNHTHISIASLPGMQQRTLTLNGFSKAYAMSGWRLGYVAGDVNLIQVLLRIHQNTTVCANTPAQWGAIAALDGSQISTQAMIHEFDRRRKLLIEQLNTIPNISFPRPEGAMYIYINVSKLSDDAYHLANQLLEKAHTAVIPWDREHIRIAYGNSYENLAIAIQRMRNFFMPSVC